MVFARDPVLGQVKTRLQAGLPPLAVLALYTAFLEDTLALASGIEGADCWVGVHPDPSSAYFATAAERYGFRLFAQEGQDLGERMLHALTQRLQEGYERAVIIGSDSPTLPADYVGTALTARKNSVTIGPTTDSGYYLVGMGPQVADIFTGVDWGTDRVLRQTLANSRRLSLKLQVLQPWYDVDRMEDLRFLRDHLDLLQQAGCNPAPATTQALQALGDF
jgi:hypothetical protein